MGVLKCASLKIISLSNIVVVHLPNVMLTRYTAVTAKYHFRKMLIGQGMANILTQFQIRNHSNMIGNETDVKKRLKLLEQRFKDALELLEDVVKKSLSTKPFFLNSLLIFISVNFSFLVEVVCRNRVF